MVRFKRRWLMVQVECSKNSNSNESKTSTISRKDLIRTIRDNLLQNFGQAATALAAETQVRFWDPDTRLALIRTSREGAPQVRATLTLTCRCNARTVALHIRSVHGSTRTLQMAAIRFMKQYYREQIVLHKQQEKYVIESCLELEQHLQSIQQLE